MPEPIFEAGPVDTPYTYTVSGTGTVTPRDFHAVYDGTNAAGDFVPAVVIKSQAGHVIARAILQSTITAGDGAEVSWFRSGMSPAGSSVTTQTAALITTSSPTSGSNFVFNNMTLSSFN